MSRQQIERLGETPRTKQRGTGGHVIDHLGLQPRQSGSGKVGHQSDRNLFRAIAQSYCAEFNNE
jgi:hypothetical protein